MEHVRPSRISFKRLSPPSRSVQSAGSLTPLLARRTLALRRRVDMFSYTTALAPQYAAVSRIEQLRPMEACSALHGFVGPERVIIEQIVQPKCFR